MKWRTSIQYLRHYNVANFVKCNKDVPYKLEGASCLCETTSFEKDQYILLYSPLKTFPTTQIYIF